jgi:cellulose synthase/poly-beta-1,6-N-acetylglucosamine synthase-like glycosyltransferase
MQWTETFLSIVGALSLIYGAVAFLFVVGLWRARRALRRDFERWPSVSLVLPARNEAKVLERTILSLLAQDYPGEWEIIAVDDRSTDSTPAILARLAREHSRVRFQTISEPNPPSPKKHALAKGIEMATGEIICTTDADCLFHPEWLRTMISYFDEPVGVVAGLTRFKVPDGHEPLWQKVQNLDFMLQGYLAAAAIGLGVPGSCNGSNLAYRRTVYDAVVGFSDFAHQVSGDDVLFAQKVSQKTGWKMVYASAEETIVDSLPVPTLRELLHQRLRWASKGLNYRGSMKFLLFSLYFYYALLLVSPVVALLQPASLPLLAIAILWKAGWDWAVIYEGCRFFRQQDALAHFFLFEIAHTALTPFLGIGGLLLPFRWKGDWYRQARLNGLMRSRKSRRQAGGDLSEVGVGSGGQLAHQPRK